MNNIQNDGYGKGLFGSIFSYFKSFSQNSSTNVLSNNSNNVGHSYTINGGGMGGQGILGGGGGNYWPNNQQSISIGAGNNSNGVTVTWPYPIYGGPAYSGLGTANPSNYTYYVYSYKVMKLPKKEMPKTAYICGKMVTLGILGSDCECAYTGEHLVFAPGVAEGTYLGKGTIILEYSDETYSYCILDPDVTTAKNALNTKLISVIPK